MLKRAGLCQLLGVGRRVGREHRIERHLARTVLSAIRVVLGEHGVAEHALTRVYVNRRLLLIKGINLNKVKKKKTLKLCKV